MISNMAPRILFAALLLASASVAQSRSLAQGPPSASPPVDNCTVALVCTTDAPCKAQIEPLPAGSKFAAMLNVSNNIKPLTGPAPAGVPSGTYTLVVDESGKKASWILELCDVPDYVASHLHVGSTKTASPPPLIPLEAQKCPPVNITGCSYTANGSFTDVDITPLASRPMEVTSVETFADFVKALKDGNIYINVHSKLAPNGLIRGNVFSA